MSAAVMVAGNQTGSRALPMSNEGNQCAYEASRAQAQFDDGGSEALTRHTAPEVGRTACSPGSAPTTTPASSDARPAQWAEAREPSKGTRHSTHQYIQLARPLLIKRFLNALDGLAEYAQTPGGGIYVLRLDQLTCQALEQLFDDGYLTLLLAVRNALVVNNAWMQYSTDQVRGIQSILVKYADRPFNKGLVFRQGALELKQFGIRAVPIEIESEMLSDAEA